jgi:hypothetical protein
MVTPFGTSWLPFDNFKLPFWSLLISVLVSSGCLFWNLLITLLNLLIAPLVPPDYTFGTFCLLLWYILITLWYLLITLWYHLVATLVPSSCHVGTF